MSVTPLKTRKGFDFETLGGGGDSGSRDGDMVMRMGEWLGRLEYSLIEKNRSEWVRVMKEIMRVEREVSVRESDLMEFGNIESWVRLK